MKEKNKVIIRVYTADADPECYPEGLAGSVHFSCFTDVERCRLTVIMEYCLRKEQ